MFLFWFFVVFCRVFFLEISRCLDRWDFIIIMNGGKRTPMQLHMNSNNHCKRTMAKRDDRRCEMARMIILKRLAATKKKILQKVQVARSDFFLKSTTLNEEIIGLLNQIYSVIKKALTKVNVALIRLWKIYSVFISSRWCRKKFQVGIFMTFTNIRDKYKIVSERVKSTYSLNKRSMGSY